MSKFRSSSESKRTPLYLAASSSPRRSSPLYFQIYTWCLFQAAAEREKSSYESRTALTNANDNALYILSWATFVTSLQMASCQSYKFWWDWIAVRSTINPHIRASWNIHRHAPRRTHTHAPNVIEATAKQQCTVCVCTHVGNNNMLH